MKHKTSVVALTIGLIGATAPGFAEAQRIGHGGARHFSGGHGHGGHSHYRSHRPHYRGYSTFGYGVGLGLLGAAIAAPYIAAPYYGYPAYAPAYPAYPAYPAPSYYDPYATPYGYAPYGYAPSGPAGY
jgi:hypothetical protein